MPGLAVTSLTLSHFRSYRSARLAPGPGPIALFGPNGSGKTNLLEAVSLLSPGRGLRRAPAEEMGRRPDALGWKIRAEIDHRGQVHEIETWSEGAASRQVRIDGKAATQLALGRIVRVVWLIPAMDRLWIEGADGRRRFLDRLVLSFEPGHGEAVLGYEKAMRERNRLLKDQVRDPAWYDALEAQMAARGAEIQANRLAALERIAAAQEEAATVFPAATLELVGPDGPETLTTEQALRDAFGSGRREDLAAGRTLKGPHRADLFARYAEKGIEARQSSTGEQKALLLSLILSNARALAADTGAPPLLLLDEVAAHLDAGRRAALYEEIAALGAQAWMTGTGPELFEDLGSGANRYPIADDGSGSTLTPAPA
ncbi:DNA replication/repair protein RecF [Tropicimonas isoalkanivorans]|uniref:DNA replication and repair protein RecF n=1 Tax=Tropicimonas isoalkanivorans TaxID=441112 RepID=A0A1I1Q952_9RHOB|nr:DNA replication/repair protein RecF [Tropicimonas isoalkanivorans]SFD18589.1 DNA replication and repair protein RecF [Tropicimonas isoalkanivorans]